MKKKERTLGKRIQNPLAVSDLSIKKRAGFYPLGSLEGKRNYKRLIRIEPCGSAIESVLLRVLDDRLREQIICNHFLSSRTKHIIRERVGVRFLGRDNPWDFEIALSTGEHFWLEITAISEDEHEFTKNKSEQMLDTYGNASTLPLSLIRKLHRRFPSDRSKFLIDDADARGLSPDAPLESPWSVQGPRLFFGRSNSPHAMLFDLIREAVAAKSAKKHDHKDQTILVVDNRASAYDIDDFRQALPRFEELRAICPFEEIWLYNGYYSDDDGGNAEWQFVPILLPDITAASLVEGLAVAGAAQCST